MRKCTNCFQEKPDGSGTLELTGRAHQAAHYSSGLIQGEILSFLKLQVKPITKALQESMKVQNALYLQGFVF
jgi:hypothetical protein